MKVIVATTMSASNRDVATTATSKDQYETIDTAEAEAHITVVASTTGQQLQATKTTPPTGDLHPNDQHGNSEWGMEHIKTVYRQVKIEYTTKKNLRLQYFMSNHCDKVLHQQQQVLSTRKRKRESSSLSHRSTDPVVTNAISSKAAVIPSLAAVITAQQQQQQQQQRNPFSVTFTVRKGGTQGEKEIQTLSPIPISAATTTTTTTATSSLTSNNIDCQPLPPHMFCLPIHETYRVDDQPELSFVPMIEKYDDKPLSRRTILSAHTTCNREELVLFGSLCQQEDTNMILDTLFQRLFASTVSDDGPVVHIPPLRHSIWDTIAKVTGETILRIRRRIMDWASTNAKNSSNKMSDELNELDLHANTNTPVRQNQLDIQYEKTTESYRQLWCRQCFIYDCNMHGLNEKPSVSVQTMLAKTKERDGHWIVNAKSNGENPAIPSQLPVDESTYRHISELNDSGKAIFKQLYSIFEGNTNDMACMLRVPERIVETHLSQQNAVELLDTMPLMTSTRKKGQYTYYSVKNYRQEWYKQYRDSKIFSYFFPCLHDGICQEFNCSCLDNRFFCTDACAYSTYSPNYYRGCSCTGICTQQCTCFLSKRECDPNLCTCTTCTDPPNQRITKQKCRNDNITMNRCASQLLIGRSSISGWGLFTRYSLKTGDYVGKYIGELMSQDEADRRGLIADARDCTYMFLISSDLSIDASRKGNKLRFINHSDHPNIEPKTIFVRGQQEIGLFALRNIPEQTELFFDYNSRSKIEKKKLTKGK